MHDIKAKEKEIDELLKRGVGEFIDPEKKFKERLLKKIKGEYTKEIIIKFGVDPTRPDIHIGHAVIFWKLRKFQELGCKIVFLVGDFTAQIGDPTGKSKIRPEIDQAHVEANMKTYLDQVGKILRTDPAGFSWIRNSDWFTAITDLTVSADMLKLTDTRHPEKSIEVEANSFIGKAWIFSQTRMQITSLHLKNNIIVITLSSFLRTLRRITHSQLIERDMFQERINSGTELYMHEMMYPVLQGIDSVAIQTIYGSCDLEVGGTDQTFNMLMGRTIMKDNQVEPQAVLAFQLLEGLDGKEKMSKSLNNYVGITDSPQDMFGKIMSIPDSSIAHYFELATFTALSEIKTMQEGIDQQKINPRDYKVTLGKQIVALYYGEEAAKKAEENFVNTFKKGELPEETPEVEVSPGTLLADILLQGKIISSKTEFRRLIDEGAISIVGTDEKITDPFTKITDAADYKIGKRRFIRIFVK